MIRFLFLSTLLLLTLPVDGAPIGLPSYRLAADGAPAAVEGGRIAAADGAPAAVEGGRIAAEEGGRIAVADGALAALEGGRVAAVEADVAKPVDIGVVG